MNRKRPPRTKVDSDGVRTVSSGLPWTVIIPVGIAVLVILVIMIRLALRRDESEMLAMELGAPSQRRQLVASPAATKEVRRVRLIPIPHSAAPLPGNTPVETASPSSRTDFEENTPAPSVEDPNMPPTPEPSDYGWEGPAGMNLFPPPGTNPPKAGILVPDNFELPTGYMRHHQTTDDGRSLAPILTFHPDFDFVDEQGNPFPIPEDRVVPPEMAPPGIPLEILEVPETIYPTGPSEEELQRIMSEHPELEGASPEEMERIMDGKKK